MIQSNMNIFTQDNVAFLSCKHIYSGSIIGKYMNFCRVYDEQREIHKNDMLRVQATSSL